jgi:hypothetical protein
MVIQPWLRRYRCCLEIFITYLKERMNIGLRWWDTMKWRLWTRDVQLLCCHSYFFVTIAFTIRHICKSNLCIRKWTSCLNIKTVKSRKPKLCLYSPVMSSVPSTLFDILQLLDLLTSEFDQIPSHEVLIHSPSNYSHLLHSLLESVSRKKPSPTHEK